MSKGKAVIDDHICIYCGKCVKVCPVHAILKDREKVKLEVETNIISFQKKMKKHKDSAPQSRMLKGEIKRLEMQKKIIQGTLRKLKSLKP